MFPTKRGSSPLFLDLFRYNRFRSSASPVSNSDSESIRSSPSQSTQQTPSESIRFSPSHPTQQTPVSSHAEGEGSSIYAVAEVDPFPAIGGLKISGEAFPGRILQACGYSINGTTSCTFKWIRYAEDGSVNYIVGAKQVAHLVTADDVDSFLAVEVQPMDYRNRKGDIARVFANEKRKITCDPNMQEHIEKTLTIGHISYEVLLSVKFMDISLIREQAVLTIKWSGYSLKSNGPCRVNVTEKFLPSTAITIPYGSPTEFIIKCADGDEYHIESRTNDSDQNRDIIILTMRLFQKMALEKMERKKRGSLLKS